MEFGIGFDPDPNKGYGGLPNDPPVLFIGIVQNVLFQRGVFEYDGGLAFQYEFANPAVDIRPSAGPDTWPFTAEPYSGKDRPKELPYIIIKYTSGGYGEIPSNAKWVDFLDTSNTSGVQINNKPDSLFTVDSPQMGAPTEPKKGSFVRRIEQVVSFQAWLVALPGLFRGGFFGPYLAQAYFSQQSRAVLAFVPSFTLTFWLERKSRGNFLNPPAFDYGIYVENGSILKRGVNRSIKGIGPSPFLQPKPGNGGRNPVTEGLFAIDLLDGWLNANRFAT
jgi:hypothetical protein